MGAVVRAIKTGTVTIRLPLEQIEQLQQMAKVKGCTLSELVREYIQEAGNSSEVLKRLQEVETNLSGAQQAMADVLVLILTNVVGARYHASLATTYADDIITVMQTGNVLSEKEVERRQDVREKEAQRIENAVIALALGAKGKGKPKN
jgi:predicted DNA-binding protein